MLWEAFALNLISLISHFNLQSHLIARKSTTSCTRNRPINERRKWTNEINQAPRGVAREPQWELIAITDGGEGSCGQENNVQVGEGEVDSKSVL